MMTIGTSASDRPVLAYLSIGSNVGDRESHMREAVERLSSAGRVVAVSSFYETEPVEFTEQPWFLNCAASLETSLSPPPLMASILRIEREMGRRRLQKKGPRSIDIDILLFGNLVVSSADLIIPHPSMHQRRFVLEPLAELAPEALHPSLNKTILELRDALPPGTNGQADSGMIYGSEYVHPKHPPDKENRDDGPRDVNDPVAGCFRFSKIEHAAMVAGPQVSVTAP